MKDQHRSVREGPAFEGGAGGSTRSDDPASTTEAPRVVIDVAPVRPSPTGVGTYVRRLVRAVHAQDEARHPLIGARAGGAFDGDLVPVASRFRARHYHAWLQLFANGDTRRTGASLVHDTIAGAPLRSSLPYV